MATRPNRASRYGPGDASGIAAGFLPPGISQATLVLSTHRPETVPLAKALMADHDTDIPGRTLYRHPAHWTDSPCVRWSPTHLL